ncbi:MAG: MAPEG family protein [Candidatus Binatia bacterium]
MSASAIALAGFAGWQLLLTFVLGGYRTALVNTGRKAANAFAPDGSDVGGFGRRLTRARDNCYENLPVFAALVLAASVSGRLDVTDPLAMWVLYARIGQSATHLASTSVPAVFVRFGFYLVQIGIMAYWAIRLLG